MPKSFVMVALAVLWVPCHAQDFFADTKRACITREVQACQEAGWFRLAARDVGQPADDTTRRRWNEMLPALCSPTAGVVNNGEGGLPSVDALSDNERAAARHVVSLAAQIEGSCHFRAQLLDQGNQQATAQRELLVYLKGDLQQQVTMNREHWQRICPAIAIHPEQCPTNAPGADKVTK